ncbi:MAG: WD40 repeat domain-containing protein [Planctomycetaceae bacterium]|jgi:WD40 repeat protein|nr:WD40 repeat domain-containing protein [Planctomycetaceae bacterium]
MKYIVYTLLTCCVLISSVQAAKEEYIYPAELMGSVFAVASSPDGSKFVAGGIGKRLLIFDAASGKELKRMEGDLGEIRAAAFSLDGKQVIAWSEDVNLDVIVDHKIVKRTRSIRTWDAESGKELKKVIIHTDIWFSNSHMEGCYFSPDRKCIIAACHDNTVRIWDTESGEELHRLGGEGDTADEIRCIAVSPDGTKVIAVYLISPAQVWILRTWDTQSGKKLQTLTGGGYLYSVTFSPDGKKFVTAGHDHIARIWDTESGKELQQLRGHTDSILGVAFSPDGTKIATSASTSGRTPIKDGTLRIWDTESGKELQRSQSELAGGLSFIMFSSDGKRIVADNPFSIWNVYSIPPSPLARPAIADF